MFIKLLKMDETDNWFIEECPHKETIKTVWGVYVFDPNWRVHLCEFTPSSELHKIETQIEFHDGGTDEEREEIEDWFREHEDWSEPITYMHCHDIDEAKSFKEGWFPTMSVGVCRMSKFAADYDFDPDDKAERPMREQRHDWGIQEAIEYCQQSGV